MKITGRHLTRSGTRPTSKARLIAARENGRQGGIKRARMYQDVLEVWAATGGDAVLAKYGREYFVKLRKRRQNYYKRSQPESQGFQGISPAALASKKNGKRGGMATARLHSPEERREWARRGGRATRERHGFEFYREIRKRRTQYPRGYLLQKTKDRLKQRIQNQMTEILKHAFR
jgi:hypothetical protein